MQFAKLGHALLLCWITLSPDLTWGLRSRLGVVKEQPEPAILTSRMGVFSLSFVLQSICMLMGESKQTLIFFLVNLQKWERTHASFQKVRRNRHRYSGDNLQPVKRCLRIRQFKKKGHVSLAVNLWCFS